MIKCCWTLLCASPDKVFVSLYFSLLIKSTSVQFNDQEESIRIQQELKWSNDLFLWEQTNLNLTLIRVARTNLCNKQTSATKLWFLNHKLTLNRKKFCQRMTHSTRSILKTKRKCCRLFLSKVINYVLWLWNTFCF